MQTHIERLKKYLLEEADFNRSWTDGRRGGPPKEAPPAYIERRLSIAAQRDQWALEIERMQAIEAAARNLVKVKGRYHTEQAFSVLAALLVNTNSGTPPVA